MTGQPTMYEILIDVWEQAYGVWMWTDRGFAPEIRSKAAKEQRAPHHLAFGLMPQIAACLRHL
jgi:hypothetical protein